MDVLLLGFISGFIYGGYRTGFIRRLAGLGFIALSFVLGAYARQPIGALISSIFNVPESYGELIAYIFIFPAVLIVAHVLANPILKTVAVTGLSLQADRILGAIFGGIEAVLIISVGIVIFDTYFASISVIPDVGLGSLASIQQQLDDSTTVQILRSTTVPLVVGILGPFLPKDISTLVPTTIPGLPGTIPGIPTPKPSPTR